MVIELEIKNIINYLEDGDKVLDAGCANGYSTINYATQKQVDIYGFDYIPEMIEQADSKLDESKDKLLGTVKFGVGDIIAINQPTNFYDKVIVTRVLINLAEWTNQLKAIHECTRVLKPGGLLVISEATIQGWQRMNALRKEWGLSEVAIPPFNQYLDQEQVIALASSQQADLEFVELVNFSSTYFVGTRVLKPLLIKALSINIDAANPNLELNRWFSQIPAYGDYGTQKLFVFRKK